MLLAAASAALCVCVPLLKQSRFVYLRADDLFNELCEAMKDLKDAGGSNFSSRFHNQ